MRGTSGGILLGWLARYRMGLAPVSPPRPRHVTTPHSARWDTAIGRALIGPGSTYPITVPTTTDAAVTAIEGEYQISGPKAGKAAGIPERTWRRWARGREVKSVPARLARAFRRAGLSPQREAQLRAAGQRPTSGGLRLSQATFRVSGKKIQQNANLGTVLRTEHGRNLVGELIDAYLSAQPGAMTAVLQDAIDTYGEPFGLSSVIDLGEIEFG